MTFPYKYLSYVQDICLPLQMTAKLLFSKPIFLSGMKCSLFCELNLNTGDCKNI
jgi:hypothetical protein